YWALGGGTNEPLASGTCVSTTVARVPLRFPATMRASPTLVVPDAGDWSLQDQGPSNNTVTGITNLATSPRAALLEVTVASGLLAGDSAHVLAANTDARFTLDAEL